MAILGGMIVLPFYMPKTESQKPFKTDILTNGLRGVYGLFLILTLYAAIYFMGHQLAKEHKRKYLRSSRFKSNEFVNVKM